jgi:poly(3-hydroxybutyrate) depolymerase
MGEAVLYQLYDWHRASLRPFRLWAEAVQTLYRHPFLPTSYTGLGRAMAAGAEVFERVTRRFGKPDFDLGHTLVDGLPVAVTERVVLSRPFCELLHFSRDTPHRHPRVLLVAPISGHHATLLRGTVEALLPEHDVYVTDWLDARLVPLARGRFDLDDHIEYLMDFMRLLGPETHVIAVCQPAVSALAAAALLAQAGDANQPRSLTLMGGPIDVTVAPTVPSRLAQMHSLHWFERTVISQVPFYYPGAFRRVFPGFIQLSGFMSMNFDRHVGAHFELFNHLIEGDGDSAAAHRRFYDEYLSVMDMPAEFYLQTVATVFHRADLARGTMRWREHTVDPGAITGTALLTIEGERDDISAPGQTTAAHRLCPNIPADLHDHHLQGEVGHFGIFNGRRWRNEVLPVLRDFIRRHDRAA